MKLKYVVLHLGQSRRPARQRRRSFLPRVVREIKRLNPNTAVEALTPDFQGVMADVETVVASGLEVFAQNVETVRRLTHPVVIPAPATSKHWRCSAAPNASVPTCSTKASLMLGLGEVDEEIETAMDDMRAVGVDILTLGQYLRPTPNHLAIERWVTPAEFEKYREWALAKSLLECVSGPLVRSSYRAEARWKGAMRD